MCIRDRNSGYGSYEISGAQKYLAYAPVPQTDGWTVAVTAPVKDFLGTTYTSTVSYTHLDVYKRQAPC